MSDSRQLQPEISGLSPEVSYQLTCTWQTRGRCCNIAQPEAQKGSRLRQSAILEPLTAAQVLSKAEANMALLLSPCARENWGRRVGPWLLYVLHKAAVITKCLLYLTRRGKLHAAQSIEKMGMRSSK